MAFLRGQRAFPADRAVARQSFAFDAAGAVGLLRDGVLGSGLLATGLVSAIIMATLVDGPFYLSGVLGLGPAVTGLVMSVGPGLAAISGVPAGRVVDRLGSSSTTIAGLAAVGLGSIAMTVAPAALGVAGYVGGLVLITAGYALFQAANNTAVVGGAAKDRRGVTSALLVLARNLGLIAGASAMGTLFEIGSRGGDAGPGAAARSSRRRLVTAKISRRSRSFGSRKSDFLVPRPVNTRSARPRHGPYVGVPQTMTLDVGSGS